MTIEKIDDKRLIIALSEEDMKIFDVTFKELDWNNEFSKSLITQLLMLSKNETGFLIDRKKIMIEVLPQNGGCVIFITLISKLKDKKRKIYRIKGSLGPVIFTFKDIEYLINAVENMGNIYINIKSKLVEYQNYYFLILYPRASLPIQLKAVLSEYGIFYGKGSIKNAQICEKGNVLINKCAIKIIYKYFCKNKS